MLPVELTYVQMVVKTSPVQQFLVQPLFDHLLVIDDQCLVGLVNGAQRWAITNQLCGMSGIVVGMTG